MLLAHPDVASFDDLKTRTLFVSKEGMASYFQWLKADFGFKDSQVKPYTFNPQPFLVDKRSAMQGYVTSEPYAVEKAGGFKPTIFLLADKGFNSYSTLIETRRDLIEKKPDLVQRFVDASIIGWYNYLYGDNKAANALIRKHNPEMSEELIAYSVAKMKEYGIVDSGDTLEARHRRAHRCAHEKLFRQDGARGRDQAERGLSPRLFHPIRQQRRRARPASEALSSAQLSWLAGRRAVGCAVERQVHEGDAKRRRFHGMRCRRHQLQIHRGAGHHALPIHGEARGTVRLLSRERTAHHGILTAWLCGPLIDAAA